MNNETKPLYRKQKTFSTGVFVAVLGTVNCRESAASFGRQTEAEHLQSLYQPLTFELSTKVKDSSHASLPLAENINGRVMEKYRGKLSNKAHADTCSH